MTRPLLEVRSLRKTYGDRVIFDIPFLALEPGESYVLTGDNGCGKTTLLRVLAGLERARLEECRFEGKPVLLDPFPEWLRRQMIYVHQHPYLFKTSIADNIAYGLKARGLGRTECASRVAQAMEWAGVAHLAGVPPHKLSGGEKQRVALARVRVLEPKVYLFDEPTASLDEDGRAITIALIQKLCGANNVVLVACHDRDIIRLPHMHRFHMTAGVIRAEPASQSRSANGSFPDATGSGSEKMAQRAV